MIDNSQELIVSVNCIAYNQKKYIKDCLDGIVMQKTTFRFEAIVHDDVSTDGTADVIKEYAQKYPNIIKPIFEKENQWSKNDGSLDRIMLDACKGKYIAFCEGDDYWIDPYKLQKQVDILENDQACSMVCSRAYYFSQAKHKYVAVNHCLTTSGYLNVKDIIRKDGPYITTCSIILRRFIVEALPDFHLKCHVGDYPLQIRCAMMGHVYYLDDVTCVYRIDNPNSWCGHNNLGYFDIVRMEKFKSELDMLIGYSNSFPKYKKYFIQKVNMGVNCQYLVELDNEQIEIVDKMFEKYNKYKNIWSKIDYKLKTINSYLLRKIYRKLYIYMLNPIFYKGYLSRIDKN